MDKLESFERLSPARQKLLLARLRKKEEAAAEAIPPSPRRATGEPFPLSFSQQRLWFLVRLDPGNPSYNVNDALRIEGPLSVPVLRAALGALVARHEALRTRFGEADGTPWQAPSDPYPVDTPLADLSALPDARGGEEAERLAGVFVLQPFDVARGPHLRSLLVRPARREEHLLLISIHHIVSDGWSVTIYQRELAHLYEALATGRPAALPPLPIQFADYAAWQVQRLEGETLAALLASFTKRISGAPTVLDLPADHKRPPVMTHRGARLVAEPPGLARTLDTLAGRPGDTRFMALLAGFAALLARLTDREDLLIGSPFANRTRLETEGVIGFFVNTLVIRLPLAELTEEAGFDALVALARRELLAAWSTQELPFERAVAEVNPERDSSRPPLFQVVCSLHPPAPAGKTGAVAGLTLTPVGAPARVSHLDLGLEGIDAGSRFLLEWRYSTDLFEEETVRRFAGLLDNLLNAAAAAPARPFRTLPWMSVAEVAQALGAARGEPGEPRGLCLHQLFERQAAAAPAAVAVIAGHERSTYGELAARAGRLARRLREAGVGPEVRVGLCLPRSLDLVVATLAVLAAGGAYVPLDPTYPRERLTYMVEDAGVAVLVGPRERPAAFAELAGNLPVLSVDEAPARPDIPLPAVDPGNLAYVLYTSGSTGRPKGVALEHRSAVTLMAWARRAFSEEDLAGVLGQASISFDLWVFELFAPLTSGGTLVLVDNLLELPRLPEASRVTLVNLVPSLAAELLRQGSLPSSVRTVTLGGEAPARSLVDRIFEQGGDTLRVFNIYGPTEDTTMSAAARQQRGDPAAPRIGRAIAGGELLLLDRRLTAVPPGVPGEIFLGGEGLARGYLGRPDLTAERFVPHPWAERPGERLYRTGDLARRAAARVAGAGGDIEFLGRIDRQVKLRGFRIELAEVEAALEAHPRIARAAAAVAGPRLLAFFVPAGEAPAEAELFSFLQERLPTPMLPAGFRALAELPLSPAGKVDRQALLRLAEDEEEAGFVAPREGTETLLAAIWADLLGAPRVGARDDFFALGGHSLLAVRLTARLFEEVGVELPIAALFEKRRLCDLAGEIDRLVEAREQSRRIDGLIEEIGDLSEEELLALLASQGGSDPSEDRDG